MTNERWTWLIAQTIPSVRGAGERIVESLLAQLEKLQWNPRELFGVRMAVEEAVVNAIKHGNRLNPDKRVRVECRLSRDRLWIEVADEGCGFDPAAIPDPTHPENLCKPSGRGVMLMRNYMTRVEYNQAGNAVILEKVRAS